MQATIDQATQLIESENYEAAIHILTELSASGSVAAMGQLALCYQFGFGLPIDLDKAEEMLRMASDLGDGVSAHNLGTLYMSHLGTNKDSARLSSLSYMRAHSLGFIVADAEFYDHHRRILKISKPGA
jgi:uncharacterized protein